VLRDVRRVLEHNQKRRFHGALKMRATDDEAVFRDAFNMLCGKEIGSGIHRTVFECKIRPDLVVKVENECYREFANVREMKFWCDNQYFEKAARWLAPCEFLSPDGRILLQKRAEPLGEKEKLPPMVPSFLGDLKRDNFGRIDGKLVCVDYAITIMNPDMKLKKAGW
jgi:hypothetical protein